MLLTEIRSIIRMLILENETTVGYKMIFLAGLPGSGKSTLLRQLEIEDKFTNCNIDNFYEQELEDNLGTKDLHTTTQRYVEMKSKIQDGYEATQEELDQFEQDKLFVSQGASLFSGAIGQFKTQIDEVCELGSNFIIDGTSANFGRTSKDLEKYTAMGYDCAMIMVDIDVETSQQRNIERGQRGGRSIWNRIIAKQGKKMPENLEKYRNLFGDDRFFLVPNKGSLQSFRVAIEAIRRGVTLFMES